MLAACSRGAKVCAVCQRDECKAMAFRVMLDNGKTVETCCPRCGLHYVATLGRTPRALQATDFATGKWIDAKSAVFVSGSDVSGCSAMESRRDAQGCCLMKAYDRCLPSLAAFADRSAAAEFQRRHGGELLAFSELSADPTASVSKEKSNGGKT